MSSREQWQTISDAKAKDRWERNCLHDLGRQDLPLDACDACGEPMKYQGHCKWRCLKCGFLRTCQDTI